MPAVIPASVSWVLWPPVKARSSWSLSTVLIACMPGDATCAASSGRTVVACPTNTGESSGRAPNVIPSLTRSLRVGSRLAVTQKSLIVCFRVMKVRNCAASGPRGVPEVATSALPPRSPPPRLLRGANVASHANGAFFTAWGSRKAPAKTIATVSEKNRSLA